MAIPNTIVANHHIGTTTEDITTSIDVEDFPFLAEMMNGLYSDPIAAVLREYPTNAWDSHVEAGVTRPIEVTLPTPFSPQLVIRDFGLGLSINDLRDVYSKYGRSLKRDSNNVAGQLGMGCKSALSYAPSFTINAVKGGVRVVAIFTKNEAGLGVIKVLDTVATDDPNGVTIIIPVENSDIHAFGVKAHDIFRFWEPGTVLVNGKPPVADEYLDTALWLDTERQTCLVRHDALDSSYVVMGNVAYPVPDAERRDKKGNIIWHRFVANLNIGDVDFVPSREDVKYTARTKETLAALTDYIFAAFGQAFAKALAQVNTPWEETKLKLSWASSNKAHQQLVLRGSDASPIWDYNPNPAWGRRQATKHLSSRISDLIRSDKTTVITGFTAKTVSTDARVRIQTYAPAERYLILTTGVTGVTMLDGRDNVVKYADIVAATAPAKRDKAAGPRAPKVETRYVVYCGPGLGDRSAMTVKELAKLAADASNTLLYLPSGNHHMSYRPANTDNTVYVVDLYSSAQLPRIERFVPSIRSYYNQVSTWRDEAEKALTNDDKVMQHAKTKMARAVYTLPADKIEDPTLAKFIRLHKAPITPTLTAALALGVPIPEPSVNTRMPNFSEQYPLLNNVYGHSTDVMINDVVLYVNAKYTATVLAVATTEAVA